VVEGVESAQSATTEASQHVRMVTAQLALMELPLPSRVEAHQNVEMVQSQLALMVTALTPALTAPPPPDEVPALTAPNPPAVVPTLCALMGLLWT